MKKAVIVLDENGVPVSVGFDDGNPVPINAFLFLSNVPTEPPSGHILAFGNSDVIGHMIFNFWRDSACRNPEGAFMLESVCRDIIKAAETARGPAPPTDKVEGAKFH